MDPEGILDFVRARRLAVVATVADDDSPQAALVGIAVTNDGRVVFDTVTGSRKYANLRRHKKTAIVVGWEDEVTVQLEGIGEEPTGADLAYCKDAYFDAHPDGRERQDCPTSRISRCASPGCATATTAPRDRESSNTAYPDKVVVTSRERCQSLQRIDRW